MGALEFHHRILGGAKGDNQLPEGRRQRLLGKEVHEETLQSKFQQITKSFEATRVKLYCPDSVRERVQDLAILEGRLLAMDS